MSLVVVGLSHHTSSVALREQLAFAPDAIPRALRDLSSRLPESGAVILSTCNRVEVYVHHPASFEELAGEIRTFLAEWHGIPARDFQDHLYQYEGREAAEHLFRVGSSLDSLVVGEVQILGQIHDAYLQARAEQTADKAIHGLFQKAFSVAKKVRTTTAIGEGRASISSVAVDLALSVFRELAGKTVMVIGLGEKGELTLRHIASHGAANVIVANGNAGKAQSIAALYGGEAIALDELASHLHRADIVISTTADPRPILHAPEFQQALKKRGQRPMLVIDIAVPRDVDTAVGELNNIYLYDIDGLEKVVNENIELQRKEIDRAMTIIKHGVDQFMGWMHGLAAEPMIVSINRELDAIREKELRKTLATLPDLTKEQHDEITALTKRIVQSILSRSMTEIKHEIGHHDPQTVLHLVKRIFGLEEVPEVGMPETEHAMERI